VFAAFRQLNTRLILQDFQLFVDFGCRSQRTLKLFGAEDQLQPESNRSVIIEFLVEDVDATLYS
jgi:hypothetical protein